MARKKILHLITGLELGGGAENMLLQLLPAMQEELENRVCVIRGRGEIARKLEKSGIAVDYLDLRGFFDMALVWRYRKVLKDFKPDIQVNYLIHADIFGRIFGKLSGAKKIVPYIRNIHKDKKIWLAMDKFTLRLADFVLTNSETARKFYIEKMGVQEDKILCVPNAVDAEKFKNISTGKNEKLAEIGIPSGRIIIGSVARLEKQKDIPTLLRAFRLLLKRGHNKTHLLVIGHGKEEGRLKKTAEDFGIADRVTFLKKRTDMPELLAAMDIFVLPSLKEGMSNGLLEAMASKKIVITSDIPENVELIEGGVSGLNFRAGDPEDLLEKIEFCLANKEKAAVFGEAAFSAVKNKYDLGEIRKKFTRFLEDFPT